ncbi:MAG: cytochrome-c oxidase, cbb3-type subunit II [Alphaproteobacteria bacterium]|nr:cytochrome-c oxidase, cbb3-type subunit II [Alphaproteobacteria bacterium]
MNPLKKHEFLEKNSFVLLIAIIVTILIGGIIEIIPLFRAETVIEPVKGVRPYTPLELAGYNIYIREGCYNCHSQQIRPLRDEVERYGHYSLAAESMYDHPFQWGSKRTGPDLARVGKKYSDEWHVAHMMDPRSVVPESIMPSYRFLMNRGLKMHDLPQHLEALALVGVPYTDEMIKNAKQDALRQATGEPRANTSALLERYGENVAARDFDGQPNLVSEMDALVAYLQMLGTLVDFNLTKEVEAELNQPKPENTPVQQEVTP